MPFPQPIRKLFVLIHILGSIGWIGAVAAFLALAVTGVRSSDLTIVRSVYIAMEPVTWWIIVPLAFVSFFSGLVLSLGTKWGLLRHYWVVFKLLINLVSLPILLLHTGIIHRVAAAAVDNGLSAGDLYQDRLQLVLVSAAALVALVIAGVLSVYKPQGVLPVRQLN
jgi:hypothetical protein